MHLDELKEELIGYCKNNITISTNSITNAIESTGYSYRHNKFTYKITEKRVLHNINMYIVTKDDDDIYTNNVFAILYHPCDDNTIQIVGITDRGLSPKFDALTTDKKLLDKYLMTEEEWYESRR